MAASSWHWVDPSIGWRRAYELLRPGGWMALLGNEPLLESIAERIRVRMGDRASRRYLSVLRVGQRTG